MAQRMFCKMRKQSGATTGLANIGVIWQFQSKIIQLVFHPCGQLGADLALLISNVCCYFPAEFLLVHFHFHSPFNANRATDADVPFPLRNVIGPSLPSSLEFARWWRKI